MTTKTELRVLWPQLRNAGSRQTLEEARHTFFPRASRGSMVLLDFSPVISILDFWPPEL